MALRQLGEPIEDYDGLVALIRGRLAELGTTCENASALAGLSETHISKLVNPKRTRLLARMSLTVVLQTLGIKLTATVDDAEYAPLRERLPQAKFNRWGRPRELRISIDEVGGEAAVAKVPELLAAVTVPIVERPKPKPAPPVNGTTASSLLRPKGSPPPVQLRPKIPPRGLAFGRGNRKASRSGAGAAA